MTIRRISTIALLLAAAGIGSMATPVNAANPTLMAYERGIEDPGKHSEALRIATLEIRVDLVGTIADSTVTAKFVNPAEDFLEGRFTLDLPPGAVVTGYALDVDDTLIDGVLVDPLKARREYQARVRENIDPGVAEVSRGNQFSTTIYPIRSDSSRTIRLRFSAPVHPELGFTIPLATAKPVGRLAIEVRASAVAAAPALTLPRAVIADWRPAGSGFVANAAIAGKSLTGELHIAPVKPSDKGLVTRHPNGTRMFQISDSGTPRAAATAQTGQRVRVYWDRSLSRRDDRLNDELALLDKYFSQAKPASIDLVVFNSSGARVRRAAPADIAAILRGVLYRGATSFAVLEKLEAPAADVCLVFSDGVVTIDARRDFKPGCQVFAIASAPDADAGFLARLSRANGGAVLRLDRQNDTEILSRLRDSAPRVVDARAEDGSALRIASIESGSNGWLVVGKAPEAGGVILRLVGLGNGITERRYSVPTAPAERFAGAGALWAADRVASLGAEDGAHEALVTLSRRFSVASPILSFIVLEQPSDYVEADIAPPANYPNEQMKEYREYKAESDAEKRAAAAERLAHVIEEWEDQKEWWAAVFKPEPVKKIAPPTDASPAPARPAPAAPAAEGAGEADLMEVAVTGIRASMNSSVDRSASITTEMEDWSPDRPYLKALDAASPAEIDRVLAREERRNSMLPAFYFDVAEWLFRKKRAVEAVEMLLSALELPVANEETASMVADRLLRYGRADRAVWLYERANEQSYYLPQPKRTLALALARRAANASPVAARADLRRAVALLNEVVITPWDDSYDGVEMVALMEVNGLLPKLMALGEHKIPLNPQLRALLDLDIRVVIEWNTGATDLDLWVDEPGGERAIYSHPRTAIGGRLSNDMTQGYGPEEYLLRRAVAGEYRISVNVYASDSINPNGTTVVTAHLLRNFGRAGQQEETMELELKPSDEGEKLIGRFTVK
jgi:hypothetical protein